MAESNGNFRIHDTAYVHPSCVLQGNVEIGAWSIIEAGTILVGNITIGENTTIRCNAVVRGSNTIGDFVQIHDNVCIEGGRGPNRGTTVSGDYSVISNGAWINHGASLHGSYVGKGAAIGLNAALNYNCRIGDGAIVTDGTACGVNMIVPENCVVQGIPAKVVKVNIDDEERLRLLGLLPEIEVKLLAEGMREFIRKIKGL